MELQSRQTTPVSVREKTIPSNILVPSFSLLFCSFPWLAAANPTISLRSHAYFLAAEMPLKKIEGPRAATDGSEPPKMKKPR
jgi:hypothetical protein